MSQIADNLQMITGSSAAEKTSMHLHTAWMVEFVDKALSQESWSGGRLLTWCLGIGFPAIGRADPPHVNLWDGINASAHPADAKRKFAEKIAGAWPDILSVYMTPGPEQSETLKTYEGREPGSAILSLWRFMHLLEEPDALGPIVRQTVIDFHAGHFKWLAGENYAYARRCQVFAAQTNQDTEEFKDDWVYIAAGRGTESRFKSGRIGEGKFGLDKMKEQRDLRELREINPFRKDYLPICDTYINEYRKEEVPQLLPAGRE